jgi:hypothetical protein
MDCLTPFFLARPTRAIAEAPSESGYGLLLVEEVADRWGAQFGPVPSKTVWAEPGLNC